MLQAFDTICGSSFGGWTDREMAVAIIKEIETEHPKDSWARFWNELAEATDDDIDLDYWTEVAGEWLDLPPYTFLGWEDNELRVLPAVESALEDNPRGDQLPECNTCDADFFCVVSDHGNVTLYGTSNDGYRWREVWAVV